MNVSVIPAKSKKTFFIYAMKTEQNRVLAATNQKQRYWAQPAQRPVSGARPQQHRGAPHEARGRSATRINAKTPAEGRRNQAQGTLFFLHICTIT